jgi:hypothetical protein
MLSSIRPMHKMASLFSLTSLSFAFMEQSLLFVLAVWIEPLNDTFCWWGQVTHSLRTFSIYFISFCSVVRVHLETIDTRDRFSRYDVVDNVELFSRDMDDGVHCMACGKPSGSTSTIVLVGGNCCIQVGAHVCNRSRLATNPIQSNLRRYIYVHALCIFMCSVSLGICRDSMSVDKTSCGRSRAIVSCIWD